MSLQGIVQGQPPQQQTGMQAPAGTPEQIRAAKNAMLLQKLQQMPPQQRQMVIALAQKKRREREALQQQGQQPTPPQQQAPPQQPVQQQPVQQQQPVGRVDPRGFKQIARGMQQPSLAGMLQQRPRVGMGG